ncbi:MAG: chloride channel protein [Vagococcus sp.]
MKMKQIEYVRLFYLAIYGVLIGSVIGILEVGFGKGLLAITEFRQQFFLMLIWFLPLAGMLIHYIYQRFGGISHQGMGLIFDVGHGEQSSIPLRLIPIVIGTTWLTHLFGGSAGREGVAVQIGATVSHQTHKWPIHSYLFGEQDVSQVLLITGMAAGFSGLFQTPIAAVFFALEVLVSGHIKYQALLPASTAAASSFFVSTYLGLETFRFQITVYPNLTLLVVLKLMALGCVFGLIGLLFTEGLNRGKKGALTMFSNGYCRIFFGGLVLVVLLVACQSGRYAGLGTNLIAQSLDGGHIYGYDFIIKMVVTILTLSIGFQGGEVTPLFAIGCTLGVVLAPIVGLPSVFVAALGYVAVFGSATNTLFAPIMIGGEVFGFHLIPYFFVVMCVAYSCNQNKSIYAKQQSLI